MASAMKLDLAVSPRYRFNGWRDPGLHTHPAFEQTRERQLCRHYVATGLLELVSLRSRVGLSQAYTQDCVLGLHRVAHSGLESYRLDSSTGIRDRSANGRGLVMTGKIVVQQVRNIPDDHAGIMSIWIANDSGSINVLGPSVRSA